MHYGTNTGGDFSTFTSIGVITLLQCLQSSLSLKDGLKVLNKALKSIMTTGTIANNNNINIRNSGHDKNKNTSSISVSVCSTVDQEKDHKKNKKKEKKNEKKEEGDQKKEKRGKKTSSSTTTVSLQDGNDTKHTSSGVGVGSSSSSSRVSDASCMEVIQKTLEETFSLCSYFLTELLKVGRLVMTMVMRMMIIMMM